MSEKAFLAKLEEPDTYSNYSYHAYLRPLYQSLKTLTRRETARSAPWRNLLSWAELDSFDLWLKWGHKASSAVK